MRIRAFLIGAATASLLTAMGGCPVDTTGDTTGNGGSTDGVVGPAGADGAQGAPGAPGADGADGAAGPQGPVGLPGADGADGADGLACWDLNGNGIFDPGTEDMNGNGTADAGDCQGDDGAAGQAGQPGGDGADGADGADGLACWDLNGNGVFDLASEDMDGDGVPGVGDCQGASGAFDGTVARGTISAAGTWDPNDGLGIESVDNTTPGLYIIKLAVDNTGLVNTQEDYAVILTVQQPAPPALLFASWEFVSLTETQMTINVRFRNVNAVGVNTAFSLLVLGP